MSPIESEKFQLLGRMLGLFSLTESEIHTLKNILSEAPIVQPSLRERIIGRLNGKTSLRHELVLRRMHRLLRPLQHEHKSKRLTAPFILRVDDFPYPDYSVKKFLEFHYILARHGIKYLLGVTPFLHPTPMAPGEGLGPGLDPKMCEALCSISQETDFALHGFSHRTIDIQPPSELAGLTEKILDQLIRRSLEALNNLGIQAKVFIPPFNTFLPEQVQVLSKYFRILCGGPESLHSAGFRLSPSVLDGMVYLPSYPPAYGPAREVLLFVKELKKKSLPAVVPLTLHWTWEVEDDFQSLEQLCAALAGHTQSIQDLITAGTK